MDPPYFFVLSSFWEFIHYDASAYPKVPLFRAQTGMVQLDRYWGCAKPLQLHVMKSQGAFLVTGDCHASSEKQEPLHKPPILPSTEVIYCCRHILAVQNHARNEEICP